MNKEHKQELNLDGWGEDMPIIFTEQGDRKYVPYLDKHDFVLDMEKLEIVEVSTGNRISVYDSGYTIAQIQAGMDYIYKQKERG